MERQDRKCPKNSWNLGFFGGEANPQKHIFPYSAKFTSHILFT